MNKVIVELVFTDTTMDKVGYALTAAQEAGATIAMSTGGLGQALLNDIERTYGVRVTALPKGGAL